MSSVKTPHMAISTTSVVFFMGELEIIGLLSRALGLIQGRSRADPHKNYMAVSINLESFFVGILVVRPLLFWVFIRAPGFCNLPYAA